MIVCDKKSNRKTSQEKDKDVQLSTDYQILSGSAWQGISYAPPKRILLQGTSYRSGPREVEEMCWGLLVSETSKFLQESSLPD